jgi:tight adherence protein B
MRKALLAILACGAYALVPLATASAADDSTSPLKVVAVDTKAAPNINLTVQVPPELVTTPLPDEAFGVVEAGRKRVAHVVRLPGEALSVVLLIDTSGSMRGEPLDAAKAAAINFIPQLPSGTQIAVIGFGNEPYVVSPFTNDVAALTAAIDSLQAGGETALYDAVLSGADQLAAAPTARRDLVVMSDGGDTRSSAGLGAAASAVRAANATVHPVALVTPETDLAPLRELAAPSGQQVVSANDPAALQALYTAIAVQIASQYDLSFRARHTGPTELVVSVAWNNVRASTSVTVELPGVRPPRSEAPTSAAQSTVSTPTFANDWVLALGGGLAFVALSIAFVMLLRARTPKTTLALERVPTAHQHDHLSGIVDRASRLADRTLEKRNKRRALNDALERAGINMRTGEFAALVAAVSLAVLFFGLLLSGPLIGLVLAILTILAFRIGVTIRTDRRRARFAEQLGDTLQLLASNLRTGHGLLQSIDTIAEESEDPTREEFRRIVLETRLGQDLSRSLQGAADRVGSDDFEWVVQAIEIHREVGGDLAEVLDNVGETIRDRNSIRRQVRTLSAEGRLSGVILFLLPIGLALVISIGNPNYLGELTGSTTGKVMIGIGVILMIVGGLWLRRLCRIVF